MDIVASSPVDGHPAPARGGSEPDACCVHCGQAVPRGRKRFCCSGCEAVYGLLQDQGLLRYYDLRGEPCAPAQPSPARAHEWLSAFDVSRGRLSVDVQGIHCSACVWLLEEVYRKQPGASQIRVNPGIGRLDLWFEPDAFDLVAWARRVESFGYLLGPQRKTGSPSRSLALRLGVTAALAANTMMFSFAFHFGLSPQDGAVYEAFGAISFALATLAVLVGGTFFLRSAWTALKIGTLHLDLPIALGIALSWGGSVWAWFAHGGGAAYFDTVGAFTALMLLGKYLPQRLLERNRARVLQDDGVDRLPQKRLAPDGSIEAVPAGALRAGDTLVLAPGDLTAVDVRLQRGSAVVSLDWITGEAAPQELGPGETIPAGAFNLGSSALRGEALQGFAGSRVRTLLASAQPAQAERTAQERFLDAFSRWYVVGVLGLGSVSFLGWWLIAGQLEQAMLATVAVLVVTCPCAIGLAAPLAYDIAQGRLRRRGLFLRTPTGLDKLAQVREIAVDKTGTLTEGALGLANPEALSSLGSEDLAALRAMVEASNHPHSRTLALALGAPDRGGAASGEPPVTHEWPGQGLEMASADGRRRWRLGSHSFVLGEAAPATSSSSSSTETLFALIRPGEGANPTRIASNHQSSRKQPSPVTPSPGASSASLGVEGPLDSGRPLASSERPALGVNGTESASRLTARTSPRLLGTFRFEEQARPEASEDLAALERAGYRVQVLSGDSAQRAMTVGALLGLPAERCHGGLTPEDKARWIRSRPARSVLMLGDGINDSLAFEAAACSGTPAIHRPFVPAKVDFYYLSPGLGPIRELLAVARRLRRVVRVNLTLALLYNAVVVALAMAGQVTPLFAAVAMPASSILFVLATSTAMSREGG
ncbi:MAG: heavy metal translocating P-type ATPase [Deltaproteobacteria bacterium]|nr:heavy metal translocating P-type ATPase [Deltaproteobacteria bacterium]